MSKLHRKFLLLLAVPGTLGCVLALAEFFREIIGNRVPWRPLLSPREHYLAVGSAFSRGFATGFFLCFFLMLVAVAVGTWYEQRREARGVRPTV